jgi:hypothetical protein
MWDKQKEVFLPSTPGLGMHVEVKDPDGKVNPHHLAKKVLAGASCPLMSLWDGKYRRGPEKVPRYQVPHFKRSL